MPIPSVLRGPLAALALGCLIPPCLLTVLWLTIRFERSNCDFRQKVANDIKSIDAALGDFAIANHGQFPDNLEALVVPDEEGRSFLDMKYIPKDLWGRDYIYEPPRSDHHQPWLCSYGRDGQPGGEGDDADLDNLSLRTRR